MSRIPTILCRKEHEPPFVTERLGWKYHHIGVPTDQTKPGEIYLKEYKMFITGFDSSPYGIEWMRFEKNSPVLEIIQKIPHIAFEVDDLDKELKGKKIIGEISSPMDGIRVAMIMDNGAPIELMELKRS